MPSSPAPTLVPSRWPSEKLLSHEPAASAVGPLVQTLPNRIECVSSIVADAPDDGVVLLPSADAVSSLVTTDREQFATLVAQKLMDPWTSTPVSKTMVLLVCAAVIFNAKIWPIRSPTECVLLTTSVMEMPS